MAKTAHHRCSRKRTTFLLLAKALLAFSVEHFFQIPRRGTPRPPRIIKIVSEKSARVVRLVAHPRLPLWCCLVLILGGRGVGAARKTCGRAEIRCVSMKKGWCVCVSTRGSYVLESGRRSPLSPVVSIGANRPRIRRELTSYGHERDDPLGVTKLIESSVGHSTR